jgi:hypothetical protein
MCTSADHIDLSCLRKGQRECQESRSLLADRARGKVYAFINRMTLDHDLSEDLCLSRANGTTPDNRESWEIELCVLVERAWDHCRTDEYSRNFLWKVHELNRFGG